GDIIYRQQGLTFGIEICEDAWVGKNRPGYDLVKRGAKMIFNPSASHFAFGKTLLREELAIPFSKETGAVFLSVNMLGNEAGRMIFDGDIILAQNGVLMAKNKRFSMLPYQLLTAEINPENFDESRRKNFSDS